MSAIEVYQCEKFSEICPFNSPYPRREPVPYSKARLPSCNGVLVDIYQIESFCEPCNEISSRVGFPLGICRLEYLAGMIRKLFPQEYVKAKVRSLYQLKPGLKQGKTVLGWSNEKINGILFSGVLFAMLLNSSWSIIKKTEENLKDYACRTSFDPTDIEELKANFELFQDNLIEKYNGKWLKMNISAEEFMRISDEPKQLVKYLRGSHPSPSMKNVPCVFKSSDIDLVCRVPEITNNLLSALGDDYFEKLAEGLSRV